MKKTAIVFSSLLLIFYFCSYQTFLSHIIYYNDTHHLFQYTSEYAQHIIHWEGVLSYLSAFVIQFFHYAWLGSLLMALMLAGIYYAISSATRQLSGRGDLLHLGALLSVYLFVRANTSDYAVANIVGVSLATSVSALLALLPLKKWKFIPVVVWLGLLYIWLPVKELSFTIGVMAISVLSAYYVGGKMQNKKCRTRLTLEVFALVAICCVGGFYKHAQPATDERNMVLVHKAAAEGDWDKVQELSETYLDNEQYPQYMMYYHNLAVYHKGSLLNDLCSYPQVLGENGLYIPWSNDSWKMEEGGRLYDDMGHWNAAMHWESEALVKFGENAPHLLNLVRYYIKTGRPMVAQRFITLLDHTLFYRDSAEYYRQHINDKDKSFSADKYNNHGCDVRIISNADLGPEASYISDLQPHNKMAFEYLIADLLLTNRIGIFGQEIGRIKNFHYDKLPKAVEEGLCLYRYANPQGYAQLGLPVSDAAWKRFNDYCQAYEQKNTMLLQSQYRDTYWYYVHFINPKGNQVTM